MADKKLYLFFLIYFYKVFISVIYHQNKIWQTLISFIVYKNLRHPSSQISPKAKILKIIEITNKLKRSMLFKLLGKLWLGFKLSDQLIFL
jgi:hypothetical protein